MRLKALRPKVAMLGSRIKPVQPGSWRAGKTTNQRGYGYRWQQYRKRFLEQHPLCVMCKAQGRVTASMVVDHVTPHRGDERLFWDSSNHQALCTSCHSGTKQAEEAAMAPVSQNRGGSKSPQRSRF